MSEPELKLEKAPIIEAVIECGVENWDGGGALAVDDKSVLNAINFIRALPDNIPLPEFAPEPDGAISLDWIESRSRIFSISIGPSLRLGYAWLDGCDKGHGVASFDSDSIPARLLEGIRRIINHGNIVIRS